MIKIEQKDACHFSIRWSDGEESLFRLSDLQLACPCVVCSEKRRAGKRIEVPADLSAKSIENVGRYALRIEFMQGCSKGIYSLAFLRDFEKDAK